MYVYVYIFKNCLFFKRYYSVISLICRYFVDLLLRKSNYIIIYLCFDFYEFKRNMKDDDILSMICRYNNICIRNLCINYKLVLFLIYE